MTLQDEYSAVFIYVYMRLLITCTTFGFKCLISEYW